MTETLQLLADQNRQILERLERIEKLQSLNVLKDGYSTDEVAERVRRKPFTVRQWANKGRIQAHKVHGSGPDGEWRVSADELARIQLEGPRPERTYDNRNHARNAS
jgi:excisionase family DNA binding protein